MPIRKFPNKITKPFDDIQKQTLIIEMRMARFISSLTLRSSRLLLPSVVPERTTKGYRNKPKSVMVMTNLIAVIHLMQLTENELMPRYEQPTSAAFATIPLLPLTTAKAMKVSTITAMVTLLTALTQLLFK